MKTIAQIAEEAGVNVQTVYRRLNKVKQNTNESLTTKIDGVTYFTGIGEKIIIDSLTFVKQQKNNDKPAESEMIAQLTVQIEKLQEDLRIEREHSRQQAERFADISEKLTELTRNSQVLLKQEQDKTAYLLPDESQNNTSEPPSKEGTKKRFWGFWKK